MRRLGYRFWVFLVGIGTLGLVGGCDDAGVVDIVYGALQLAFGIVNVAT